MSATKQQGADNLRHALAVLDPDAVKATRAAIEHGIRYATPSIRVEGTAEAMALICAIDSDRASIVAFLTAKAAQFEQTADHNEVSGPPSRHLYTQASLARNWAAQIARGDDRLGGAK